MIRRFRPTLETLENREVFSASPWAAAPVVEPAVSSAYVQSYIEQDNLYKSASSSQKIIEQADPNQQQIIAILIGLYSQPAPTTP